MQKINSEELEDDQEFNSHIIKENFSKEYNNNKSNEDKKDSCFC